MAWPSSIPTFTALATLTAAKLNDIRDALNAVGGSWTTYIPAWDAATSSPTLNNGVITGAYRQLGKTVDYRISLVIGSTTALGTGYYTFTLPVSTGGSLPQHHPVGTATAYDATGLIYTRQLTLQTSTLVVLRDNGGSAITNASPVVWATGDRIMIQGSYEIA